MPHLFLFVVRHGLSSHNFHIWIGCVWLKSILPIVCAHFSNWKCGFENLFPINSFLTKVYLKAMTSLPNYQYYDRICFEERVIPTVWPKTLNIALTFYSPFLLIVSSSASICYFSNNNEPNLNAWSCVKYCTLLSYGHNFSASNHIHIMELLCQVRRF